MGINCTCQIEVFDFGAPSFYSKRRHKAKKEHVCGECNQTIAIGEHYEYVVGKEAGRFYVAKTCNQCVEIRDCFCCSYFIGELFDLIQNDLDYIELSGLETLSPAARGLFFNKIDLHEDTENEIHLL